MHALRLQFWYVSLKKVRKIFPKFVCFFLSFPRFLLSYGLNVEGNLQ